ncbi:MAG TPA: S41 family peptidase, partial [Chitinophagaceae bacterium]|nr:S41 family peptidase [Chitinophagaceae bacterium]
MFIKQLFTSLCMLMATTTIAQQLSLKEQEEILANTKKVFAQHYHFKNQIKPTINYLDQQWRTGMYDSLTTLTAFTLALSKDLQHFTHDKHLNFFHQPAQVAKDTAPAPSIPWGLLNENFLNNGMTALQVLPGDVGYMRLQAMGWFEETMPAAFTYLQHTRALIIDLRGNGGGMLTNLISSYLLPEDSIHLITISWNQRVDSIFTVRKLNGPRYLDKPVYLLTDKGTFSSAEEFAYDLQNLKRATIVGATTGGGANPGGTLPVYTFTDGSRLDLFISMARVESPITKTNWEGTGVRPDVESLPEAALQKAHMLALE